MLSTSVDQHVTDYLNRLRVAVDSLPRDELVALGEMLFRAYQNGKQVLTLGNGGSASTASHMSADLGKNTIQANMRRFRVLSLNDNVSLLTALANDKGYENVFSEQISNLIRPGDLLIVISASGDSPSVLEAIRCAQARSAEVAGLLGFGGGRAAQMVDLPIVVAASDYGIVEDVHLVINHILVEHFQRRLEDHDPWVV
jgi:D-sedoheptulose 7-phosphate isomerase